MSFDIRFEDLDDHRRNSGNGEAMARRLAFMLFGTDQHVTFDESSGADSWSLHTQDNNFSLHGDGNNEYRFNRQIRGGEAADGAYRYMLREHASVRFLRDADATAATG